MKLLTSTYCKRSYSHHLHHLHHHYTHHTHHLHHHRHHPYPRVAIPVSIMRLRIDLDPYKDEILDLLAHETTHEVIRTLLQDKYHITISRSGLKNRLREWQSTRSTLTQRSDIQDRVRELLPRYNTKEILTILDKEGTPSSERTVRRIRDDLGIKLRLSPTERQQELGDVEAILMNENMIGDIEDFGRRNLYRHLRAMGLFYTEYISYYIMLL
jgi:hypothetical protein